MVSEQMEESLRHEIDRHVESRLSSIKQEIAQFQTQLNESLKRVLETQGEAEWDGALAASISEHLRAAHERGVELAASESAKTQAASDMAIVKAAIEEMQGQNSQAETLKSLVNRASSFAPRIVFFVVKGDQARGWRGRGFEGSIGDETVQQISVMLSDDTMVRQVVDSRTSWSGTPDAHGADELVWGQLSEQAPQRIVAVPLVVRGRTVAVLYADSAGLDADAINLEALETLVRVASMAVTLLSVTTAPAAAKPAPAPEYQERPQPVEAVTAYTPTREYEEPAAPAPTEEAVEEELPTAEPVTLAEPVAAPEPLSQEQVAEVVAEPAVAAEPIEPPAESFAPEPEPVEPQPIVSAPEPIVPEPVETFASPEPMASTPVSSRRRTYDAALPVDVTDEEEKRQHQDARRFARLLVSEIKLYNEPKVIEGRQDGNLYERLREYIDRSREMYDKRVKPNVSSKYDYFHAELVNTLAEGDASKLGAAYPGTTVPV